MTVSSARGIDYEVDDIVLQSYQQAGLMSATEGYTSPLWTSKVAFGRKRLDAIINEIPTSGGIARSTEFYNLTLSEGTYKYDLPAYTLDVIGNGMYIDASETDITKASGETLVKQIGRDDWHEISSKDSEGSPSFIYVHRATSPIQAWFWPIPDEAGTVRIPINRLTTSAANGESTLELRGYWMEYIVYRLAYSLAVANSLPADKRVELRTEARDLRKRAVSYSMDHTGSQIVVSYGR